MRMETEGSRTPFFNLHDVSNAQVIHFRLFYNLYWAFHSWLVFSK